MNRVKLRFFAKKRVKHYFLFFEKITLSNYDKYSISMPKGHGIALAPLKGAKLSFIEGKLES
jgi:hypothetical protein